MIRRIFISMGLVALLASTQIAAADTPPIVLNHQGRLLDASDHPVNGTVSLTFKIYETLTGGVPLWTEAHPAVSVHDGLFTEQLGEVVPLSVDVLSAPEAASAPRWLEIEVAGVPLVPRVELTATPAAAVTSRVAGDISTGPGSVRIGGMSGSTTGTIRMAAVHDSAGTIISQDDDGDGSPESSVSSKTKGTKATGGYVGGMSGSTTGTIRMAASPDSTTSDLDQDSNGDGVSESSVSSKTKGTTATGGIRGGMSGSTTGTIRMAASPDSTTSDLDQDSNGDGIPESSVNSKTKGTKATGGYVGGMSGSTTGTIRMAASPDSTSTMIESDTNGDGIPESSVESRTHGGTALQTLAGPYGSSTGRISMAASPDSTSDLYNDSNGDGIPESSVSSKTKGTKATGGYVGGMSGSTTGTIRMAASPDSTTSDLDQDSNGDGIPESSVSSKTKGTKATGGYVGGMSGSTTGTIRMAASPDSTESVLGQDSDGDGVTESSVSSKTKGTTATGGYVGGMSGSTTGTIRMAATSDSTGTTLGSDTDGDGTLESALISKTSGSRTGSVLSGRSGSTTATIRMLASGGGGQIVPGSTLTADLDRDGDGTSDGGCSMDSKQTRTELKTRFENGDIPTADNVIRNTCDAFSAELALRAPKPLLTWGTGLAFRVDGSGPSITMDADSVPSFTVSAGEGYLSSKIGIGKTPTEKIDVAGGAYCDGTNWVNASDKNSKENFRKIDAEKLLEKISELAITEWNYKGEQGVTHIGPTAQDFKKSFGVGKNDKSISTIDPSGIALAAIQALKSENDDLRAQIAELREMIRAQANKQK